MKPRPIATWLRECDVAPFAAVFSPYPFLRLWDGHAEKAAWPADEELAGLLLTGGSDVSIPYLRQPVPDPSQVQEPDPERDAWEWAATEKALELRLPILAICRGVQVLNVVLGGTLRLDIPGHNLPEQKNGNVQPLVHTAEVEAGLRFPFVNSSHHQALDRLGEGIVVEARHADDGTIEQVRLAGHPFAIGVQYHPERDVALYRPLFDAFVTAAVG